MALPALDRRRDTSGVHPKAALRVPNRRGNDWRGVAVLLRGNTTSSRVASTRTCGRCSCSRRNSSRSRPDSSSWWNGHMYKAKIRYEVPMLFCMAVYFNFLIGVSGRILSDVPVNVTCTAASSTLALPLHDHGWTHLRVLRRLYFCCPR